MPRPESLRAARGGRGLQRPSHLQTQSAGSHTARRRAQTEARCERDSTASSPLPSVRPSPGLGSQATALRSPASVTAAGRRPPATASGSILAERGMLGERPRAPRRGATRRPLVVRNDRDTIGGRKSPKLLAELVFKGGLKVL